MATQLFEHLLLMLQAKPIDVRTEKVRQEWLSDLAGPKNGKWWLLASPIKHADLSRLLGGLSEIEGNPELEELRTRTLQWAQGVLEQIREREKARRNKWKQRALVRHHRVMAKGEPPLPDSFRTFPEADQAALRLWNEKRVPVGIFKYLEDWPGLPRVGYQRIYEYNEHTFMSRRDLVYQNDGTRLAPGEDPNELVQVGYCVGSVPRTETLEWLPNPNAFDPNAFEELDTLPGDDDIETESDFGDSQDAQASSHEEVVQELRAIVSDLRDFDSGLLRELAESHEWQSDHCYDHTGALRVAEPCPDCRLQRLMARVLRLLAKREALEPAFIIELAMAPRFVLVQWSEYILHERARCDEHGCGGTSWLRDDWNEDDRTGCERCELRCCTADLLYSIVDLQSATFSQPRAPQGSSQ